MQQVVSREQENSKITNQPTRYSRCLPALLACLEVPLHNLLEYPLPIVLNHISVTRNDLVKVPLCNASHAFVEGRPIARTGAVPDHALLPYRTSPRVLQGVEDLSQDAACWVEVGLAELLVRW